MRRPSGSCVASISFSAAATLPVRAIARAKASASWAALATPAPTWGRATKAASPIMATRPKAMRGDSMS